MKLLVICSRFPFPLEKGDKLRMYHHIKELSKYHEITLVSVSDEPASKSGKAELSPYVAYQYHFDITKGVRFYNRLSSIINRLPIQVAQLYDSAIMNAVKKIASRHHCEHVYCQLPRSAEYARRLDLPKTIDYMDAFGESMSKRAQIQSGFSKWLFSQEAKRMKRYEYQIFGQFDNHILISQQDKSYMNVPDVDRIEIVPNGIDTVFFAPQDKSKQYDLAFVGNMGYPPNEAAASYIVEQILPLTKGGMSLSISGARPTKKVQSLASSNVHVSGWVDDIRDAYLESRVFVAPIFSGTGQQNKILESMALGVPCITTSIVNAAIYGKDGIHLLIADTHEEFVQCIERLQSDENLYNALRDNARKFVVEKYSWQQHVNHLNKIICQ